jgi:hypothetical protein
VGTAHRPPVSLTIAGRTVCDCHGPRAARRAPTPQESRTPRPRRPCPDAHGTRHGTARARARDTQRRPAQRSESTGVRRVRGGTGTPRSAWLCRARGFSARFHVLPVGRREGPTARLIGRWALFFFFPFAENFINFVDLKARPASCPKKASRTSAHSLIEGFYC